MAILRAIQVNENDRNGVRASDLRTAAGGLSRRSQTVIRTDGHLNAVSNSKNKYEIDIKKP
jgi:hypothetical protein